MLYTWEPQSAKDLAAIPGVVGQVSKKAPPSKLVKVLEGLGTISSQVLSRCGELTVREAQVLGLIASGLEADGASGKRWVSRGRLRA